MSTVIVPTAEAIKAVIAGISLSGQPVKAYFPPPQDLDRLPAGVIRPPAIERSPPDGTERQLFRNDWDMTFEVTFYADLDNAVQAQLELVEITEAFVLAIDADRSLGLAGEILDASVTEVEEPAIVQRQAGRPLLFVETTVELVRFVDE